MVILDAKRFGKVGVIYQKKSHLPFIVRGRYVVDSVIWLPGKIMIEVRLNTNRVKMGKKYC